MPLRPSGSGSLHWLHWNDEYVVFDEASGLTHHLDAATAFALMRIEAGATHAEMLADMSEAFLADTETADSRLTFILQQLARADLIEMPPE